MGMDVFGKAPSSEEGAYFRANVWWWRPLAAYCCFVAPGITAACTYWQTNDGDGLEAEDSIKLANVLDEQISNGSCAAYISGRQRHLDNLPLEICEICAGTGQRKPPPETGPGDRPCNGCDATGKTKSFDCHYPMDIETVQEFATFLRHCGGFSIC